ncbi:hypothetical protein NXC14_CH00610 [Rhizobium sp. NXC14]|nr:hypothetical protein NXC14_CH00610 [Rhizobium sp. NXC14]
MKLGLFSDRPPRERRVKSRRRFEPAPSGDDETAGTSDAGGDVLKEIQIAPALHVEQRKTPAYRI